MYPLARLLICEWNVLFSPFAPPLPFPPPPPPPTSSFLTPLLRPLPPPSCPNLPDILPPPPPPPPALPPSLPGTLPFPTHPQTSALPFFYIYIERERDTPSPLPFSSASACIILSVEHTVTTQTHTERDTHRANQRSFSVGGVLHRVLVDGYKHAWAHTFRSRVYFYFWQHARTHTNAVRDTNMHAKTHLRVADHK